MNAKHFLCYIMMLCVLCGVMCFSSESVRAEDISLSSTSLSTAVDRTATVTVTLANSAAEVWFSTSNPNIATVSKSGTNVGKINGRGVGTCIITAHCTGGATASCTVSVSASLPAPYAQNKEK